MPADDTTTDRAPGPAATPAGAAPGAATDRRTWWACFVLFTVAGLAWVVATPLLTGPDELSQARRAAAVVRGELTGRTPPGVPPVVVEVDVPVPYGEVGDARWRCFLGRGVDGNPQPPNRLPASSCPPLPSDGPEEPAATVQYRGQPLFYALVGLPTLVPGGTAGAYGMRVAALLASTALLASAAATVRRSARPGLAGLALLATATPAVLYLAASTNPSSLEVAAALSAWAAGAVLATDPHRVDGRLVARFGVGLVVLALTRGLGPLFAGGLVAVLAVAAGGARCRVLARRRDLQAWGAALAVAGVASAAWLSLIARGYALPERAGSGWLDTTGQLPWYLRQAVGVFGTNDSALSLPVTLGWWALLVAVLVAGAVRSTPRVALLAGATTVAGLVLQVTAEGLSLPPIGFFWQGRYALPVLLGGVLLATSARPRPTASALDAAEVALDLDGVWTEAPSPATRRPAAPTLGRPATARLLVAAAFVVVHAAAFVVVGRHHHDQAGRLPALGVGAWTPPLPQPLLLAGHVVALTALAWLLVRPGPAAEASGPVALTARVRPPRRSGPGCAGTRSRGGGRPG